MEQPGYVMLRMEKVIDAQAEIDEYRQQQRERRPQWR